MADTLWIHQVFVIGEASAMPRAIAALDIAFPCDDGLPRNATKPELYASKYSASGQLPATHYGAAFVVTEQIRLDLESMGLANVPGITYWRCSNPEGILDTTNHASDWGNIGMSWDWQNCLDSLGLKSVQEPMV